VNRKRLGKYELPFADEKDTLGSELSPYCQALRTYKSALEVSSTKLCLLSSEP
jgi:hypothetical protein